MHIHLSANSSNVFIMNALRSHGLTFAPSTSNYLLQLEDLQRKVVKDVLVGDMSSYPENYQSFALVLSGATSEPEAGEHVYRLFNLSGSTSADLVGDALMTGYATVHSDLDEASVYTAGDDDTIMTYQ